MRGLGILLASSAAVTLALSSAALAGGFQRGTADTDILFEPGTFSMRTGLTYVDPQRGFESINGQSGDFGEYAQEYNIPSVAFSFGGDVFGCAGTYTESFAAEADYSGSPDGALPRQVSSTASTSIDDRLNFATAASTSRTISTEFDSDEFGATCRLSYTNDMGRFSLLGGVFFEDLQFEGSSIGFRNLNPLVTSTRPGAALVGAVNLGVPGGQITLPTVVDVDSSSGYEAGYRIGAAYEMPAIALRAQVLYRSEVEHEGIEGTGTVTVTDTAFVTLDGERVSVPIPGVDALVGRAVTGAGFGAGTVIPVKSFLSDSISPQSLSISAQTGIAEGTLLLASFRWTDWSTNDTVVSTITGPGIESSSISPYNWRDGYTASLGIGRAFTDRVSGAVALGYDRGVSTGSETTYTDLYTVSGGLAFKPDTWGEIRVGGLIGYWTDGEQRISDGAYFDAEVGDDWVYAANASLKFTW